jgi:SAM-dependent methyltransferase
MLNRIRDVLQNHGTRGALAAIHARLLPARASCLPLCVARVAGRDGLEIGGPSATFAAGGPLPVYPLVGSLDNCNFAASTLWEGDIQQGRTFRFDPRRGPGRQYIAEASHLIEIDSDSYDFVLSSHTIEHTANPLAVLMEWTRVLKPDGALILIVPHKEGTFDHKRPVTPLAHLIDDWQRQTDEGDLTHLPEVLSLHDFARDPRSGSTDSFAARCRRNLELRSLHHHVFDTRLVIDVVDRAGLQIEAVEALWPFHIVCIATRRRDGYPAENDRFRAPHAHHFRRSPFKTDRAVAAGRRSSAGDSLPSVGMTVVN